MSRASDSRISDDLWEITKKLVEAGWEEYRVFSGSFDEVIQQVSETFHPVQSIEQLDCNDF